MTDWARYDGKGRPVPNGTDIELQQRDGVTRRGTHFSDATWKRDGRFPSEDVMFWRRAADAELSVAAKVGFHVGAAFRAVETPSGRLVSVEDMSAAIADSLGPDWTPEVAANAVMRMLTA